MEFKELIIPGKNRCLSYLQGNILNKVENFSRDNNLGKKQEEIRQTDKSIKEKKLGNRNNEKEMYRGEYGGKSISGCDNFICQVGQTAVIN